MEPKIRVAVVGGGMFFDEIIGPSLMDFCHGGIAGSLSSIGMSHLARQVVGISIEFCAIGTKNPSNGTAEKIRNTFAQASGLTRPSAYYGEHVWEEILTTEKPDVLLVATPDSLHTPPILCALEAGADVITEKPLCLTLDEADQIIDLAEEKKRIVGVDMHKRYDPFVREMMSHAVKKYGPLNRVRAVLEEPLTVATEIFNWVEESNPFSYVGCHWLDVIQHYLNVHPVALYATGERNLLANWEHWGPLVAAHQGRDPGSIKKKWNLKTWDSLNVNITYDNGMRGDFNNSWINPEDFEGAVNQEIEVIGILGRGMVDQQDRGYREAITGQGSRTRNPAFRASINGDSGFPELYGYGKASLAACFLAIIRHRVLAEPIDNLAGSYPDAQSQRWISMILEAAAKVAELNFAHSLAGEGAPVSARFSEQGYEILDPLG